MTSSSETDHLTLIEAITQWCDPTLAGDIRAQERLSYATDRTLLTKPKLLPEEEWLRPNSQSWLASGNLGALYDAWEELENDFRRRIERSELYLEGIPSSEDPQAQPEAIPNFWAAELRFDFARNTATRGERVYLTVTVSTKPSPWTVLERTPAEGDAARPPWTDAAIAALTDDEVLHLLEEHARRVIASPDAKLIAPGRISLIPIIRNKMRERAGQGALMRTLADEASVLADWISSKVTLHHAPKASTIEKTLGKEYAVLMARSNGAINRADD